MCFLGCFFSPAFPAPLMSGALPAARRRHGGGAGRGAVTSRPRRVGRCGGGGSGPGSAGSGPGNSTGNSGNSGAGSGGSTANGGSGNTRRATMEYVSPEQLAGFSKYKVAALAGAGRGAWRREGSAEGPAGPGGCGAWRRGLRRGPAALGDGAMCGGFWGDCSEP